MSMGRSIMKNLKNSILIFFNRKGKLSLKILAAVFLILVLFWKSYCFIFKLDNVVCVLIQGRLANAMFQEAFVYTFAKKKNKAAVVFSGENPLANIFTLEGLNWTYDNTKSCSCYSMYEDKWDCAFDDTFENLHLHDKQTVRVLGYFQSWKYFKGHEKEIRRLFTFKQNIEEKTHSILLSIISSLKYKGVTDKTVLVGVHIRRGDYVSNKVFVDFGYNVASEIYMHNAVKFYQRRYSDLLFIVCGNDIPWARQVLQEYDRVYFVEGNTASEDMALLAGTHHTLMTVGTFGWWIGWLTNGTTVYYKHNFREGTDFMRQFHGSTKEHFPPHWIGLE
ncbi:galactoside alpha-(1,2)-fucosyltransferase 2-like isoform X2 [Ostrea edulis]|uniref:galactoside alpha-(1,2)-fucosyltransferase 2-like isoform X2 n=1 Tax=Ostrea edulis TaxID=37623 RepID=UPI0024AF5DCE|nr:galactoside alpha-(1,2)-fucosyltransferase 2-like isoform X2 [Ostrea edulis]